jgi:hypothetical protein
MDNTYTDSNNFLAMLVCSDNIKVYYSIPLLLKMSSTFLNHNEIFKDGTMNLPFASKDVIDLLKWLDQSLTSKPENNILQHLLSTILNNIDNYPLHINTAIVADFLDIRYDLKLGFNVKINYMVCESITNEEQYKHCIIFSTNIYNEALSFVKNYIIKLTHELDKLLDTWIEEPNDNNIIEFNFQPFSGKYYNMEPFSKNISDKLYAYVSYLKNKNEKQIAEQISFTDTSYWKDDEIPNKLLLYTSDLPMIDYKIDEEGYYDEQDFVYYSPYEISITQFTTVSKK